MEPYFSNALTVSPPPMIVETSDFSRKFPILIVPVLLVSLTPKLLSLLYHLSLRITKSSGTWGGADKDLAAKARKSMSKESLDEKGPGLYHNINMKRKRGEKMRKKGEKGAPSAKDFENAAKTAKEERELCHSKDHDCATVVEHIVWGFGKPVYESHAIPTDDGYVAWYDVEFEHGIEREVPTEDLKIYTT